MPATTPRPVKPPRSGPKRTKRRELWPPTKMPTSGARRIKAPIARSGPRRVSLSK
jgi:hypothetical protein